MNKLVCLYLVAIMLFFTACQNEEPLAPVTTENGDSEFAMFLNKGGRDGLATITVMTRNVYVGADVDAVLGSKLEDIPFVAPIVYQQLWDTDFEARAQSLAREIEHIGPHLVGLQEISLIRYQENGDAIGGAPPNAQDVVFDYLQILLDALQDYGLEYHVAGIIQNTDVEVPMFMGVDQAGFPMFDDVRLTDYDVVLSNKNTEVLSSSAANFSAFFTLAGIDVLRGYVSVEAKVKRRIYRFVNTHLEAFDPGLRHLQAQELMSALDGEMLPTIMVGDFNTPAPSDPTYQFILSEGYEDVWPKNLSKRHPEGYTFGHRSDLLNEDADFYERIDLVLTRNIDNLTVWATVLGDEKWNKTPSGLWPSDHGGVAARMRMPLKPDYAWGND